MERKGLEDFMKIASGEPVETAKVEESQLSKLAAMIEEEAAIPTNSVVAPAPEVTATKDAVEDPQIAVAGANLEEIAAGEVPAAAKPNEGVIIAKGNEEVVTANTISKEPASVAVAVEKTAEAVVEPIEKTAAIIEAESMGVAMAHAYVGELEKMAADSEYKDAVEILKTAGLLDNYKLED